MIEQELIPKKINFSREDENYLLTPSIYLNGWVTMKAYAELKGISVQAINNQVRRGNLRKIYFEELDLKLVYIGEE